MLEGPFDQAPILLVIDDLEQILEDPKPGRDATPVKDAPGTPEVWRVSLGAVLRAFNAADTDSRLLLTSRFDFTLPDGKRGDLALALRRVQLPPMDATERSRQWKAAGQVVAGAKTENDDGEASLVGRALAAAGGNPQTGKPSNSNHCIDRRCRIR